MVMQNLYQKRSVIVSTIALALAVAVSVGSTLAFFSNKTQPITNTFVASSTRVQLDEKFDGEKKSEVTVKNIGNAPVYARIKLTSYRVNDEGEQIGGESTVPTFTPGEGWLALGNDTYAYSKPIAPGEFPETMLIDEDGITLVTYTDDEAGVQAIDVMAECIQAAPSDAVKEAWNVDVSDDGVLSLITD